MQHLVEPATSAVVAAIRDDGVEIDDSPRRRAEYAYDASNYRVLPQAVAFPRDVRELRAVLARCSDHGIPVTVRGGGTSMAGNSVGPGVVVDLSRRLTRIGEVDRASGSVWADAGVVLGELRAHVERVTDGELTFAPDPSSASRVTVGGAIGNDACGNHSVAYGRTTHHIRRLELVTVDGAHLVAGPGGVRPADPGDAHSAARAEQIDGALRDLVSRELAAIRTRLDTIPRQVSGYHLAELLPERGFDVARALAGSEGTCAIVVRAELGLVPRPRATALLCLGYPDAVASARDVTTILESRPTALESLDAAIVDIMRHRRGEGSVQALPRGRAYLMVEFGAGTLEEAAAAAARVEERVRGNGRVVDALVLTDPAECARLWRVREDGAGFASRWIDGTQTGVGWEDSAVAPERLADYLAELLELVNRYGYRAIAYGHFGAGCIHLRLDSDLRTERGRRSFESFMHEAAALVVAHGGSLSGEHGDGRARSELLTLMYPPGIIAAFREFKRVWDPAGLLNPGVIVDPAPLGADLALDGLPGPDAFPGDVHACIGVGRCRAVSGGFMCPSYRATRDEKDSTRGRARVLQELVRGTGGMRGGWSAPEVREALDLCLSCKACASDCPTGVDIAEAKSTLLDEHYRGRLRPFTHYSIGWLPRWLPVLSLLAPVANRLARSRMLRRAGERLGISAARILPAFRSTGRRRAAMRAAGFRADGDVLLFADSFTRAFRPEVVPAAARVLRATGAAVGCTPDACCGLTWISTGQRAAARRRLRRLVDRFDDGTGRPIVVLEPSCAATIRDEAPGLVGTDAARRVAARVRPFAVAVAEAMAAGWRPDAPPPGEAVLQVHCHEHAVFGSGASRRVLRDWGVATIAESTSCCGVAGNFGFEAEHFEVSMLVAEHSIARAIRSAAADAPVLTDGFSCAMQATQLDPARGGVHLAQLLDPERAKGPGLSPSRSS